MKWLKLITLTIFISSTFCVSLNRRTEDESNDLITNGNESDIGTRIGFLPNKETETKNETGDFKFINVDWDADDDDDSIASDYKPRDFDGENKDNTTALPSSGDGIIIGYPIDELDPPLPDIDLPPRSNINKTTTTEIPVETTTSNDDSEEGATEVYIDEDDDMPIECHYGTAKFPFPKPNVIKDGRRIADIKCEEQMWNVKYRVYDKLRYERLCHRLWSTSTVVGGKKSEPGDFPHMGAVGWLTPENTPLFFCGTTLISSKYSLTAAHCKSLPDRGSYGVTDLSPKFVRFGDVDISESTVTVNVNIGKFLTLKEFDEKPVRKYFDIALIRFTEAIQFTEHVRPACLWHIPLDGLQAGNITGWGQTEKHEKQSLSKHLRYAEVDIFNQTTCKTHLNHRVFRNWQGMADSQFCAGKLTGDIDTCQADSGGPLQIRRPFENSTTITTHYVVGITAFGFGCAQRNLPGVYTSVNHYICWIEKQVWPTVENSFCPPDLLYKVTTV